MTSPPIMLDQAAVDYLRNLQEHSNSPSGYFQVLSCAVVLPGTTIMFERGEDMLGYMSGKDDRLSFCERNSIGWDLILQPVDFTELAMIVSDAEGGTAEILLKGQAE